MTLERLRYKAIRILAVMGIVVSTMCIGCDSEKPTEPETSVGTVTDLRIGRIQDTQIELKWTAPQGDPQGGRVAEYDLRFTTSPLTASNWGPAERLDISGVPRFPGGAETEWANLNGETRYWFGLKAYGSSGDVSALSNVVDATTGIGRDLIVRLDSQSTELPARVSVVFKVDTESGLPVPNLVDSDFEAFDNGQPESEFESQRAILPLETSFSSSVGIALDISGSVTRDHLEQLKEAASTFVSTVAQISGVEIGLFVFDGEDGIREFTPFSDREDGILINIEDRLSEDLVLDNTTDLNGAVVDLIDVVQNRVASIPADSKAGFAVIFTDGTDRANRTSQFEAISAVNNAHRVYVFTIGLGGEVDPAFLAEVGRDGAVIGAGFDEITDSFAEAAALVRDEANSYYVLAYCSPVRSGTSVPLEIIARYNGLAGRLETSYSALGFTGGCTIE